MPAEPPPTLNVCHYCHVALARWEVATHISSPEHLSVVKQFKRQTEYRNRQQELPGFNLFPAPRRKN